MDPVVREVVQFFDGFFNQFNPYNSANLITYFAWLVIYVATWITVWRSPRAWVRFISFLANQIFSIGILISWSLVVLIAVRYWIPSLIVALLTAGLALFLFRRRDPARAPS
ncbi:MAG: hypothetical protein WEC00_08455 [Dongiaceae bacterium]